MYTIKDVAKLAGVSTSTVSRALSGNIPVSEETKAKVMKAVKELNYKPNLMAKGLKEGKSNVIGLIIPDIQNPIFPSIVRGIEDAARNNGFNVVLINTDENIDNEVATVNMLKNRWIDGFIFATATSTENSKHIYQLIKENIPVVLIIRNIGEDFNSVVTNNCEASYEAVSYMINRGLRKIGIVNGDLNLNLYMERFKGYREALADNELEVVDEICFNSSNSGLSCYELLKDYFSKEENRNKIDGIFATNDYKAIEAVRAIKDSGLKVPEDISIMGFDDVKISSFIDPPLTTVSQPFYEIGERSVERLLGLINTKDLTNKKVEVLDSKLTIRNSVI